MTQSTASRRTGTQWNFTMQLQDLEFADGVSLLSHKQQDVQEMLCSVTVKTERGLSFKSTLRRQKS